MSERTKAMQTALATLVAFSLCAAAWAAPSDDIPRRPDGKPDLTGMYDIATLTPMVRPPQYGERLARLQSNKINMLEAQILFLGDDQPSAMRQARDHLGCLVQDMLDRLIAICADLTLNLFTLIGTEIADFEQSIEDDYLLALAERYTRFFHFYERCPLLIVNAANIDFAHNDAHFEALLEQIFQMDGARQFFNPNPTLL